MTLFLRNNNLFLSVLILLACPCMAMGQVTDKKKTVELLCHVWKSDFSRSPKKMDCFPAESDSTIQFMTNGYIVFSEKKGSEGVWNYDAARTNLYVIISGTLWKYRMRSISTTELVVESTTGKNVTTYYLLRAGE
ncbi:MAG: hypothetical protein QM726_12980 [Chitinophagaceae bacterium]